jgi:hypothetical protein
MELRGASDDVATSIKRSDPTAFDDSSTPPNGGYSLKGSTFAAQHFVFPPMSFRLSATIVVHTM